MGEAECADRVQTGNADDRLACSVAEGQFITRDSLLIVLQSLDECFNQSRDDLNNNNPSIIIKYNNKE